MNIHTYRKLTVEGTPEQLKQLLNTIREEAPKHTNWNIAPAEVADPSLEKVLVLEYFNQDIKATYYLWLIVKDGRLKLANITDVVEWGLQPEMWNSLAELLFTTLIVPICETHGLSTHTQMTKGVLTLEEYIGDGAAQALRTWASSIVNKSEPLSHPADKALWQDFIVAAAMNTGSQQLDEGALIEILENLLELPNEYAYRELAEKYRFGIELLKRTSKLAQVA